MNYLRYTLLLAALTACGSHPGSSSAGPENTSPTGIVEEAPVETVEADEALQKLAENLQEPTTATLPPAGKGIVIDGIVEFDKTVHDFGDISVSDGPQRCTFTLKNVGSEPIVIYEVATSCGCTDVTWTREPLQSGKSGTISATYKNEDGALPFDKTLTVYIAGVKKPVLLRLRGVVHEKKQALSELFGAEKLGALGLKKRSFPTGRLLQGEAVAEEALIANLGREPLRVSFADASPQLSLHVDPNPIPAGKTATLRYSIQSNPALWGKQTDSATPVLGGKKASAPLLFQATTQENFASWTAEQREKAARPMFDQSTASFGIISRGTPVTVGFAFTNQGKSGLVFHSLDSDTPGVSATLPGETPAGKKGSIQVSLDTSSLEDGENALMLTLTTNSPARPVINLFVVGEIR